MTPEPERVGSDPAPTAHRAGPRRVQTGREASAPRTRAELRSDPEPPPVTTRGGAGWEGPPPRPLGAVHPPTPCIVQNSRVGFWATSSPLTSPKQPRPMRNALRALLRPFRAQPDYGELRTDLSALAVKVRELEDQQLRRELEWAEVSEKIKRYMLRIGAVEQRQREREQANADPGGKVPLRAVLSAKYPNAGG